MTASFPPHSPLSHPSGSDLTKMRYNSRTCAVGGQPRQSKFLPPQLWEWTYLSLEINASTRSRLTRGQRHLPPFLLGWCAGWDSLVPRGESLCSPMLALWSLQVRCCSEDLKVYLWFDVLLKPALIHKWVLFPAGAISCDYEAFVGRYSVFLLHEFH